MDFDSIITFVFLLVFFILPSIFKILAKKKKAPAAQAVPKKKNPSVFEKIGDQIRKFIQELEEQARQQGRSQEDQGGQEGQNVWDTLSEDKEALPEDEWVYIQENEEKAGETLVPPALDHEYLAQLSIDEAVLEKRKKSSPPKEIICSKPGAKIKQGFRTHPLQNAVVWSEILSKPLALRDE